MTIIDEYLRLNRRGECGNFELLTRKQSENATTIKSLRNTHFEVPDTDGRLFCRSNAPYRECHYTGVPFFISKYEFEAIFTNFLLTKKNRLGKLECPSLRNLLFQIDVDITDTERTPVIVTFEKKMYNGKMVEKCILQFETRPGFFIGWEQKKDSFGALWLCCAKERKTFKEQVSCDSHFVNEKLTWRYLKTKQGETIFIDLHNAQHGSQRCEYGMAQITKHHGPKLIPNNDAAQQTIIAEPKLVLEPEKRPYSDNESFSLVDENEVDSTAALAVQIKSKSIMSGTDFHFATFTSSMCQYQGIVFDAHDMLSLRPGQYITDVIVDHFAQYIVSDMNVDSIKLFKTSWFQSLVTSQHTNPYDTTETIFGKANICSFRLSVFVCCTGMHFWLIIVSPPYIFILDSLNRQHDMEVQYLRNYIDWERRNAIAQTLKTVYVQVPMQENAYDCGLHVLKSLKTILTMAKEKELEENMILAYKTERLELYRSAMLKGLIRMDKALRSKMDTINSEIELNWESIDTLNNGQRIADSIIDFYLDQLISSSSLLSERVKILPVEFFTRLDLCRNEHDYMNLLKWVTVDDLNERLIVIPIRNGWKIFFYFTHIFSKFLLLLDY